MRPRVGLRNLVRRLKHVVLPAPFGPIRAWMVPRLTLRLTSLTATKPRNSLVSPCVSRMTSSAMRLRLFQHLVALTAEAEARDGVEVGAGDANDPGRLRVGGGVNNAGAIGARVARSDAVAVGWLQHRVVLALGIDAPPLDHVGVAARVAVDRP